MREQIDMKCESMAAHISKDMPRHEMGYLKELFHAKGDAARALLA